MAFVPARVAPAVAQRLQIPVQVLLYVGLFIFAQYLVNRWQVPLPANLVGMVMLLLLIVSGTPFFPPPLPQSTGYTTKSLM